MKKFVLVAVIAVAALGASLAVLMSRSGGTGGGAPEADAAKPAAAPAETPAPEKPREAPKKPRSRATPDEAPALAVAGVVESDGKPVAGAVVDAFAVPAADDVPDEDRAGRAMLTKMFGAKRADAIWKKTRNLRDGAKGGDPSKMGEAVSKGIETAMEMLSDDEGLGALTSIGRLAQEASLDDDGDWPKAGSAATDADGKFQIEGFAAGKIELRARAAGHVKTKTRVAAGDLDVRIALVRGARLAGVVTRSKSPVVGATATVKGATTKTGAGGRFEFDAVHVPEETLLVSGPGCVAQMRTVKLTLDGPNPDVEIALEPAGAVAGHVMALGGGPVVGARVSVDDATDMFGAMRMMGGPSGPTNLPPQPAATDAGGAFDLEGVRAGAGVKLRVEAEGYLATTVSVDVKADATSAMEAILVRESKLSGKVTDEKGAPLAGAKVRVEAPPRGGQAGMLASMLGGTWRSAVADDNGAYEVRGLAEGDRKVRVEAAKYLNLADSVKVPPQAAVARDFTLRPGYKLSGTVAGPDGKPFAGAKVYVSGKPSAGAGGLGAMAAMFGGGGSKDAAAQTGADGKWTADGLQEGPFVVKASADGFLDGEVKDVAPGRTDVALTLGAAATIRGTVVSSTLDTPVAGASVKRESGAGVKKPGGRGMFSAMLGGRGGASVTCSDKGVFEMTGLEPGDYTLTASMHGFADSEPQKVTVAAGETCDGLQIVLPPGVAVSGRVVEKSSGAAVPGAVVWAGSADSPFAGFAMSDLNGGPPKAPAGAVSATTDADGRFVLDGLSPGQTTIEVRVADHAPTSMAGVAAPSSEVVVTVASGGAVEGHVTGADGGPVADAQVMVMRGMMGDGMRRATTDADGAYRIDRVAAGSYTVMLVDAENPMAPTMASVVVKDGETSRHDFTKKTAAGRQMGVGVTRDGKPVSGAFVRLVGGGVGMKFATTDGSGRASFEGLPPGEYTVLGQTALMGGGISSQKVTVGADGKLDDVQLQLSSAKIEGDVVDAASGAGVAMAQVMLTDPGTKMSSSSDLMVGVRGQAFTDERGHFVMSDVQTGVFTMRVTATDYAAATLDGVAAGSTDVKVRLQGGVDFAVTVLGPDGHGVPNASVKSTDAGGHESIALDMTMSGFTKGDGVAHLKLLPGRYGIDVSADNLLPGHVDVDTSAGPATVALQAGATVEIAVVDANGAAVSGAKVTIKDAAGNEIQRGVLISGFLGGGDVTDGNGRFTRGGLPAGPVTVVVTAAGHDPWSGPATLEANGTKHVDVALK